MRHLRRHVWLRGLGKWPADVQAGRGAVRANPDAAPGRTGAVSSGVQLCMRGAKTGAMVLAALGCLG
jgi:hypothetical protein